MRKFGFNKRKDFALAKVQQGSLSDILREGVGVLNSISDKLEILFNVNKKWLKKGDKHFSNSDTGNSPANIPSVNKKNKGVPYFDIDFAGGFDLVFNSTQVSPSFTLTIFNSTMMIIG